DGVVRIYDIVFDYKVLLDTDAFYRKILFAPEYQREMGTAEFHYLIGRVVAERQCALRLTRRPLIAAAYAHGVPVYTSSPRDSSTPSPATAPRPSRSRCSPPTRSPTIPRASRSASTSGAMRSWRSSSASTTRRTTSAPTAA